ncbi:MAG: uroporphyrinogen-III C-methyltransferase [Burkholderiales bacterium]
MSVIDRCSGRVTLVGAGPGDPELLTLKAVRALREADVVLHDDLVDPAILAFARDGARLVGVGKRGGCRSTPQAFIEQLMIREARAGHRVVRLKGGDPFVFGRGGEEVAALHAAGIAVDVVPGITSGLAAPAAVGIPVTHRDHAHGVALVTGHAADGSDEEPDWDALARSGLTLVVYMGMARAGVLRAKLLHAGLAHDTPVAVIAQATRVAQRHVASTLGGFVEDARAARLASPAIIVIGDVAAYAAHAACDHSSVRRVAGAELHT